MSQIWEYMDQRLNSDELPTMKELISEIDENGGTDAALAGLREKQYRQYCCELIWRYPISQGDSAGGFLMPVREGILWIPYDEMEKEAGEILRTSDAVLMDEAACRAYADDFRAYADELCSALRQSAYICRGTGCGNHNDTIIDLGTFEMASDRMAVSDPCYDTDVWCRGELQDVLPGIWEASVIKRDEGEWGIRVAKLVAVHKDYVDSDMEPMTLAPFEVGVDSGQAGLFDAQHYRDDAVVVDPDTAVNGNEPGALWYMHCCCLTLTKLAAGVMPYGVVASSGYGDGSYDCFVGRNSDGKIVRVEIEFIPEEGDDE